MSEFILTSMLKRVDNAVFLTGQELIETGRNAGGYKTFSLANDGVGYALNDYNKGKLALDHRQARQSEEGSSSAQDHRAGRRHQGGRLGQDGLLTRLNLRRS